MRTLVAEVSSRVLLVSCSLWLALGTAEADVGSKIGVKPKIGLLDEMLSKRLTSSSGARGTEHGFLATLWSLNCELTLRSIDDRGSLTSLAWIVEFLDLLIDCLLI